MKRIRSVSRLLAGSLSLLALGLARPADAQQIAIYCDCQQGIGPCGNGADSDVPGGCLNASGLKAYLFHGGGTTSVSADDLVLSAGNLPLQQFGLIYMGAGQALVPFGDGLRCVSAGSVGVFRFPVQSTAGGDLQLGPGIVAHSHAHFPPAGRIQAGQVWNLQGWYRDPGGPCGFAFNLTNALTIRFVP